MLANERVGGGLYFWEPLLSAVELFVLMTGVKEEPCWQGILMTGWLSVPSGA